MTTQYQPIVLTNSGFTPASPITGAVYSATTALAYTDTTAKALFTIPDAAIIVQWILNVTTAFNDSGTDVVNIGVSGTAQKFAAAVDVSSTGLKTTNVVLTQVGVAQSGAQSVQGIYVGQNSNANAGAMTITVLYYTP